MTEHYHFIGIGGIGMSALARILLDKKSKVTGSDLSLSATVAELQKKGACIHIGQTKEQVQSAATVIYSSDIKEDNPEFVQAKALKCKMLHRSELLSALTKGYKALCVAGTHGKTTTTSLLTAVLMEAALDPSFAVGGMLPVLSNGRHGKGEYFVLEADESDGTFLNYSPFGAIVTNVEPEHMAHYKTIEKLHGAFETFLSHVPSQELLFYCGDDPVLRRMGKGVSYGFQEGVDLRITDFKQEGWCVTFTVHFEGKVYRDVKVQLTGQHNALNAAAVFGLCLRLHIDEGAIRKALTQFSGVKRRVEKRGEYRNVLLLDDYAHHPTEIEVTLRAIREAVQGRRLIALVQPHRYSRVADHLKEFGAAFDFADQVFVTDIYGAREKPIPGIDADAVVNEIKRQSTVKVSYLAKEKCVEHLKEFLRPHDVLVTLGAGDITAIHTPLSAAFEKEPPRKYRLGIVFGGKSCEHEISLRSARTVASFLNPEYYDIEYLAIDKEGKWFAGNEARSLLESATAIETGGKSILSKDVTAILERCELFFPVLHGPFGEDGTIQGFFEMLGKPYAGPDFRSAAITMDKVVTKKLLKAGNVPTPPFVSFSFWQWRKERGELLKKIKTLQWPLYVKPARVGSSIGVSKVTTEEELLVALKGAFSHDSYALVEEAQINARELEFAVLGNGLQNRIQVPPPAEKCAAGEFVSYEKKYSSQPVKMDVNAYLDANTLERGKELARRAYEAIGITGMSRVDCFLNRDGTFQFFEVNGIPGLTKLSLFPKIWDREGLEGTQLMDYLVVEALQRHVEQDRHLKMLVV